MISLDTVLVFRPSDAAIERIDVFVLSPCSMALLSMMVSLIYFCPCIAHLPFQGAMTRKGSIIPKQAMDEPGPLAGIRAGAGLTAPGNVTTKDRQSPCTGAASVGWVLASTDATAKVVSRLRSKHPDAAKGGRTLRWFKKEATRYARAFYSLSK